MLNMNWLLQAATDTAIRGHADTAATTAADADATAQVAGWEQIHSQPGDDRGHGGGVLFLPIRPQQKRTRRSRICWLR